MNQSVEIDQPYEGQKFASFDDLKKYLEEYGQRNYVKFWIRSSHTRNSLKSKISKKMNPELKYVSVKFACIFGGEKIRCRGSGIRKSSTYRNLGCPCMINAVVGEDGNHVKLDTVILEHNHVLCKTLYDSLKKTKRKSQTIKNNKDSIKNILTESPDMKLFKSNVYITAEDELKQEILETESPDMKLFKSNVYITAEDELKQEILETGEKTFDNPQDENTSVEKSEVTENCLQDIQDKYGRIVKILVINSENKNGELKTELQHSELKDDNFETNNKEDEPKELTEICRLCLSSKDKLTPIFNPDFPLESTVLSFKIMGCASIEISCNDGLPNNICSKCQANLDIAYNFRIRCENSDSILREAYTRNNTLPLKPQWEQYLDDEGSIEEYSNQETLASYPAEEENEERPEAVDAEVPSQEPLYVQFAISCPVCASGFETYESMLDHLGSHTHDEPLLLACTICTLVCHTVKDLQEHMSEHLKETASELWTCGHCETSFATEEELKLHKECHETVESKSKKQSDVKYLCNVCGKIFKTKDRFQAHRNMHEGLRPHVCLTCGKGFADRKNLHQHYEVVHLRKVRHECPVCQRKFYTRTKMKSHMTMHSGVKPFACDVCNKTFRLKMNMNKHKKTHTNFRPYRCDKCNAAFMEKNLLRRHSYRHGGIRPFQCPVCGHGFSAKFCLKKHLKDSKCRGVVIADPDSYQWVGMSEPESSSSENKCVVVYKAEEGSILPGESEAIDMDILQEYNGETNS